MPKIVDHAARREEIAEALWRVVRRDGIRAASVRTIAAEAGWSAGAVRYYFPDQAGLLSFAMDLVSRRVTERVRAIEPKGTATTIALRYLEEALPLDAERRAEFDVWMAFMAQAQAESGAGALHDHVDTVHNGLRELCESLLHALADDGALAEGLDLRREVDRLHALIDGLALHAAIQPERTTPARVRQVLRHHLDSLMA
ncbi:TetR/AcrR family transcriptional regulator [Kribbella shirazensis]|jgi:AcrR family transcriptional regulator|uniref:AcrR family transcriptional regulator n=1 Tax=Kribbella shirazensis TaxID=1105143 RepID=A0A7X5V7J2_9ACTN|nr:TetR family transcriptional regulator C-terminal domain-containing protein [Kribbella shirazensis]NIK56079.1 AcrR family transcriptional regulator [Kribbella shirazensis]